MNIFFLHWDPRVCAIMHVDRHVVKMILESCQLLCTAHHVTESTYIPPYKSTHKNHPCSKWVRESISNYKYLVILAEELCKEYTYRYNKTHKCEAYIKELGKNIPPITNINFTQPAQAMPDIYKSENVINSYRCYYLFEKTKLHNWKKRTVPYWIEEIKKPSDDLVVVSKKLNNPVLIKNNEDIILNKNTIVELKSICKERKIKGYSGKNKKEIIELINENILTISSS